ncbi:family 1 glycosylhydrolase [Massilia horti]|uniref:Glycosyl hydrolase family protein n=1 Tax=Massilia horti TaxID=2562153 RepID=A0A4Y9STS2_9BURK|nr:family 1 glycosylhydrolase [Massilia horti]TFW28877.1 glycosyl hydrolase family protein [Massilia horti]
MFKSFFLGGFECTTGYNRDGEWIDLVVDTAHHEHVSEDYRRLREVGILTVRDAIRWPLVDLGDGRYDFSTAEPLTHASRRYGIQVIWDLFHYGYPTDVDLLSDGFVDRFADYCGACARYLRRRVEGPIWFTPVNEPSYFAWAAGEVAHFAPHLSGRAQELKIALVRAAIRGIDAIRAELPDARFLHADPVCRVVPADDDPDKAAAAAHFNERCVFEALDMMSGRVMPELGGSREHLDVIGINYYWNCQWVHGEDGTWLEPDDPRRQPVSDLVKSVWERYGGDIVISETSHWGDNRPGWVEHLTGEIVAMLQAGVPLRGVCLYPIIGMLDWHAPRQWMPMGLWDVDHEGNMSRILHLPTFEALRRAQRRIGPYLMAQGATRLRA